jgi:hypothetical protein
MFHSLYSFLFDAVRAEKLFKKRKNTLNSICNGDFLLFLHPYEKNDLPHIPDASADDAGGGVP